MSNEVYIDGCNTLKERKFLIHTDKYSIGEDGLIDEGEIPFTDICYDLALQLQRVKTELEQYKKSKQASYESMQREWQGAVHLLREVQAEKQEKVLKMAEAEIEIEKLQAENEKLKLMLSEKYGVFK